MLTFEQYYACLFGDTAEDEIVREFGLRPGRAGLDEWLGTNEAEAARQGMDLDAVTPECRARMLDALEAAIADTEHDAATTRRVRALIEGAPVGAESLETQVRHLMGWWCGDHPVSVLLRGMREAGAGPHDMAAEVRRRFTGPAVTQ